LRDAVSFASCPVGGKDRGAVLTTLFSNTTITTATPIDAPTPRPKRGWLPLLTVLFCVSYALMTMLIVEQGSTIESQRSLIRELFRDSTELTGIKQRAQQERALAAAQSAPKTQNPTGQIPSTQAPSQQAPSSHVPSTQAAPQKNQTQKQKAPYQMPAADLGDARRSLLTI
jgi:hypothetical protein